MTWNLLCLFTWPETYYMNICVAYWFITVHDLNRLHNTFLYMCTWPIYIYTLNMCIVNLTLFSKKLENNIKEYIKDHNQLINKNKVNELAHQGDNIIHIWIHIHVYVQYMLKFLNIIILSISIKAFLVYKCFKMISLTRAFQYLISRPWRKLSPNC